MKQAPQSRQFEQTLTLDAPREAVWRALTDAEELARWFAPEVSVDARVGGSVAWKWSGHFDWQQTIDVLEPGRRLRTRYDAWGGSESEPHPLFIDWRLEGEGGTTTLRIVHSGFESDARFDQEYDGISSGWPIELQSLRLYLEKHRGKTRQLTWSRATLDVDVDSAWQTLAADDALGCASIDAGLEAGAPFAFASGEGDRFEGRVVKSGASEFAGISTNHGDGFLRIWVGSHEGQTMLWLWLATYGDAPPAGLQQRWDALVRRVFADHLQESVTQ